MKAKKYAKVGKKPGKPGYRTPAVFKYKKTIKNTSNKAHKGRLDEEDVISYNKK